MPTFDFITRPDLRQALAADFAELEACASAKAWKAVHVLAGSIIEAVLIDHLLASSPSETRTASLLQMTLGQVIAECKQKKVLSQKTIDLCSAVKEYRNLIHPGRMVRLQESVDQDTGRVAHALVEIVVREVGVKRRETYGYTSAQLTEKLETDGSAVAIVPHLVAEMNEQELRRFVLDDIPSRYLDIQGNDAAQSALKAFEKAYRIAVNALPERAQRDVAQQYVKIVREESDYVIHTYDVAFFRTGLLELLAEGEQRLVKSHLFSMLEHDTEVAAQVLEGIGSYLSIDDLQAFMTPLLRTIAICHEQQLVGWQRFIDEEYRRMSEDCQSRVMKVIDGLIRRLRLSSKEDQLHRIEQLKSYIELPF